MRLACLHGFTGAPESWDGVLDALAADVAVDRPHLLGHDPEGVIASTRFEHEVDRLARRFSDLGRGEWHLAGYSLGGRLAVGLLVRRPDLFASATLIGASPGLESEDERRRRRRSDERLARLLEDEGLERFVEHWESLPLFATQNRLAPAVRRAQKRQRLLRRPEGLARALRVLGTGQMPNYWPQLSRVRQPVRLMAGAEDEKFCRIAGRMAHRLPRATVEIVPGTGHNLLLEAPERVARGLG